MVMRETSGDTHRCLGLGGSEQGHGDLTEVVKHQEVQLPTVDQLRHWT